MELRLFSIEQLPRSVPPWEAILDDLGRPPPDRVARALGVGRATVYRWNATKHAPKPALLALFWLTRWGRSAVHTQATNDAVMAVTLARSLGEEREQLKGQVKELEHTLSALHRSLAIATRDSASTASHSHTDTAHAARLEAPADSMSWPMLALPDLPPLPELPPPEPAGVRPGSPSTPPTGARSGTDPGHGRTPQPPLSAQEAVARSLSSLESITFRWRHCDATPSSAEQLLELRQAPQDLDTNPNPLLWRAGSVAGPKPDAAPELAGHPAPAALPVQTDTRAGTPPSASLASRSSHGGYRPHPPAWQEPGAPPGASVFAALATVCSTDPTPARRPSRTTK